MEIMAWMFEKCGKYKLILINLLFLIRLSSSAGTGVLYEYHSGNYVADWTHAKEECEISGGKLAGDIDIDDWELFYGNCGVFLDDTKYWIGLHRQPDKTWKWLDGQPLDINTTTSFVLRPEYQDNITSECVLWDVKQPFFIPQGCDSPSPFICEMNEGFNCSFKSQGQKSVNETTILMFNDKDELLDAKSQSNTTFYAYLVYANVSNDFCREQCDNFSPAGNRKCWMYEYRLSVTECRLVISDWKPVLINTQADSNSFLYTKYCIETKKFTNCSLGEECLCGNVTTPPNAEKLQEILEETKKKLTVPKTNLSATIRKKTSAPDDRPASMTMGYFGVSMLSITFGGLVLLDCSSLIADFKLMWHNLNCKET